MNGVNRAKITPVANLKCFSTTDLTAISKLQANRSAGPMTQSSPFYSRDKQKSIPPPCTFC